MTAINLSSNHVLRTQTSWSSRKTQILRSLAWRAKLTCARAETVRHCCRCCSYGSVVKILLLSCSSLLLPLFIDKNATQALCNWTTSSRPRPLWWPLTMCALAKSMYVRAGKSFIYNTHITHHRRHSFQSRQLPATSPSATSSPPMLVQRPDESHIVFTRTADHLGHSLRQCVRARRVQRGT